MYSDIPILHYYASIFTIWLYTSVHLWVPTGEVIVADKYNNKHLYPVTTTLLLITVLRYTDRCLYYFVRPIFIDECRWNPYISYVYLCTPMYCTICHSTGHNYKILFSIIQITGVNSVYRTIITVRLQHFQRSVLNAYLSKNIVPLCLFYCY